MSTTEALLQRLAEGNARFVSGDRRLDDLLDQRDAVATGQAPFAVILGCADSRVPAEIVFDQGLGDLFVVRVAGHVVASCQIGSVEYAVEQLGTRLVVVLGHTGCGAVAATLEALGSPDSDASRGICSIVERITPAVVPLLDSPLAQDPDGLAREAVRANVRLAVRTLTADSEALARAVAEGNLAIVGAEYDLASGRVTFLESP